MASYETILDTMKTAYFQGCGETVAADSDLDIRFKAVASELFSLSCYGDFLLRQAFPQSAAGKYLDRHAALRGITRKTPSKAKGELCFYILEPGDADTEIPSGTVCAVKDKPYIQFETLEGGVIPAGETECTVSAQSLECGDAYNCVEGEINTIVNPPTGVAGVENRIKFSGGYDEEGDTSLRRRICTSYSIPQTGISTASVRELLLSLDEILDCSVSFDGECYTIYVKTRTQEITQELKTKIKGLILGTEALSYLVEVEPAAQQEFDLAAAITDITGDKDEVIRKAEQTIRDICQNLEINSTLVLMKIAFAVSSIDGVGYCEAASTAAREGVIYPKGNSYLRLGSLRVVCDE